MLCAHRKEEEEEEEGGDPDGKEQHRSRRREREISLQMRLSSHTDQHASLSACISVSKPRIFIYLFPTVVFFRSATFVAEETLVAM